MDPTGLLTRHGLPASGLEPVPGGLANLVWRTRDHVVRIGRHADHAREVRLARAARAVGIATPPPVAHGTGYSIWERWPGEPPVDPGRVPATSWRSLLADLEKLHAHPPEPPSPPDPWRGRPELIERTQRDAGWTHAERATLASVLTTARPVRHPAFVHGDAFAGNVLVDGEGLYVGIIDWGCAGWSALEQECARLEDPALELALQRWRQDLDRRLIWSMRLDLLLDVALHGRASFDRVREVLTEALRAPP